MLNFEKILEMNTIAGRERAGWLLRLQQLMSLQTFVDNSTLYRGLAFPRSVAIALLCFSNLSASPASQVDPPLFTGCQRR